MTTLIVMIFHQNTNNMIKDVEEFLISNGFEKTESKTFSNGKCKIIINATDEPSDNDHYEIVDIKHDASMYSDNLNIYWLIGVMTYYGFMDKNYKQIFEPTGSFLD